MNPTNHVHVNTYKNVLLRVFLGAITKVKYLFFRPNDSEPFGADWPYETDSFIKHGYVKHSFIKLCHFL